MIFNLDYLVVATLPLSTSIEHIKMGKDIDRALFASCSAVFGLLFVWCMKQKLLCQYLYPTKVSHEMMEKFTSDEFFRVPWGL